MKFKINNLDHVAILVEDKDVSISWYRDVLGLRLYEVKEWGEWPVFLIAGKTGVALFPKQEVNKDKDPVEVDHFAFGIEQTELRKAIDSFDDQGIEYLFKDHTHYHSVYLTDPDNHTVELTALVNPDFFD